MPFGIYSSRYNRRSTVDTIPFIAKFSELAIPWLNSRAAIALERCDGGACCATDIPTLHIMYAVAGISTHRLVRYIWLGYVAHANSVAALLGHMKAWEVARKNVLVWETSPNANI